MLWTVHRTFCSFTPLGKTNFCLSLELEYKANGILVHQSAYTERVLKGFNMDKAHPLSTPIVVRSLESQKDPFWPKEPDEKILGLEVSYLNAIGYCFCGKFVGMI